MFYFILFIFYFTFYHHQHLRLRSSVAPYFLRSNRPLTPPFMLLTNFTEDPNPRVLSIRFDSIGFESSLCSSSARVCVCVYCLCVCHPCVPRIHVCCLCCLSSCFCVPSCVGFYAGPKTKIKSNGGTGSVPTLFRYVLAAVAPSTVRGHAPPPSWPGQHHHIRGAIDAGGFSVCAGA